MPSMRCYECKAIKRCTMVLERDENDVTVGVYYCARCKRELQKLHDEGGEA
jgi:hypothetical protein